MEQPLAAAIVEVPLATALIDEEQHRYEGFKKMELPKFQYGKTKDAH